MRRWTRIITAAALAASLLAPSAALSQPFWRNPEKRERFSPPSGSFSCELAEGWSAFEHETPRGMSVHILGPAQDDGLWRASYHIHTYEKSSPGFLKARDFMRAQRARSRAALREATEMTTWRVDRKPTKVFEVREQRFLPIGRLPAEWVRLHHFYAVIPNGRTEYFVVKLSTTESTYLKYRAEFKRFLKTFRITAL